MAYIKLTDFTTHEFETREEQLLAYAINPENRKGIQNQIAKYAEERATLEMKHELPDPVQSYMYAQQKLLGSIEALQYLLVLGEEAYNELSNRS